MTKVTKSRHVDTVSFDTRTLREKYPHDPEDTTASLDDYFEDMHSQGHELLAFSFRGETSIFVVFKGYGK
jgi:hypothetical protein